jgi:hypothetical protein
MYDDDLGVVYSAHMTMSVNDVLSLPSVNVKVALKRMQRGNLEVLVGRCDGSALCVEDSTYASDDHPHTHTRTRATGGWGYLRGSACSTIALVMTETTRWTR